MELYVIGDKSKGPQRVGLARSAQEELESIRGNIAEGAKLQVNRAHALPAGWDALALRIAQGSLSAYAASNGWYRLSAAEVCTEVDKAFRAANAPKAIEPPAYGPMMQEVRKNIFGVTQEVFASLAGVSTSRVSRWESGELEPGLTEIFRLRSYAIANGIPWRDELLYRVDEPNPLLG